MRQSTRSSQPQKVSDKLETPYELPEQFTQHKPSPRAVELEGNILAIIDKYNPSKQGDMLRFFGKARKDPEGYEQWLALLFEQVTYKYIEMVRPPKPSSRNKPGIVRVVRTTPTKERVNGSRDQQQQSYQHL